jgi:glycerol-3-phosphate dehydrogenase subunit C
MKEGSLAAPIRHPLAWQEPDFYDEAKLDAELRRVFDICHTCRRCFNLCDSFPRLFDLIDESKTGELDSVSSENFKPVIDACTLCDMCFMTKCPYVPPHEFNIDFPHLMLRARAVEAKKGEISVGEQQFAKTDRNGKLAAYVAPLANWATDAGNSTMRAVIERTAGLHHEAHLPKYQSKSFEKLTRDNPPTVDRTAPAFGRKAVIFATCFANYNEPQVGLAARAVLAKNGVETEVVYPHCCGMPLLEQGDIAGVAEAAKIVSTVMQGWIDKGFDIVAPVPSCALMFKFEWPLILPQDAMVKLLSKATFDLSEYIVDIARKEGLAPGLQPIDTSVAVHISCHSRAQNMGQKSAELLRLIPGAELQVIERCSGHGGSWGYRTENFETALKVGRPVAQQVHDGKKACLTSDCPLSGLHIKQGVEKLDGEAKGPALVTHPIELLARAYGLGF